MLLYDWGFFVQPGRIEEFLAWLAENDDRLGEMAPKNYEYLGTYRAMHPEPWDFHQIWRYGTDRPPDLRAAAADQSGQFTEIARTYLSFVDVGRHDDEEFRLYGTAVKNPSRTEP